MLDRKGVIMNLRGFRTLILGWAVLIIAQASYAATPCVVTPQNIVLNAGQSTTVMAVCATANSADITTIEWFVDDVSTVSRSSTVNSGQPIYFNTSPDLSAGSHTVNLKINGVTASYSGNPINVVVGAPALTVTSTGPGSGTISSFPVGISCSSPLTCSVNSFANGGMVTLTATPVSLSSFVGWGGDCTGTAVCTVVMTGNHHVTAAFSNAPQVGVCDSSASGRAWSTQPTSSQCSTGTYVPGATGTLVTWTCDGVNGGAPANCTANGAFVITPSSPGTNGTVSPNTPQTQPYGQTTVFTATPQSGYSAVFSGCPGSGSSGANGVSTYTTSSTLSTSCTLLVSFSNTPVNGVCGTADSTTVPLTGQPTSNQCSAGSFVAGSTTDPATEAWTCTGSNNGTTATCAAPRGYRVTPSAAGANGSINPNTEQIVAYNQTKVFTVTADTGYVPTVTGTCGGSGTTSYTTNAIQANCTVSATFSQGGTSSSCAAKWAGLWLPPGTSNVYVVDQMGTRGTQTRGSINYLPGCANELSSNNSYSGCAISPSYSGTVCGTNTSATLTMTSNNIMSVRYTSNAQAENSVGAFSLTSAGNGNVMHLTQMWLSTTPGAAYSSVPTSCAASTAGMPNIYTGPGYCPVKSNADYYLNIQISDVCSNCTLLLTSDSYFY